MNTTLQFSLKERHDVSNQYFTNPYNGSLVPFYITAAYRHPEYFYIVYMEQKCILRNWMEQVKRFTNKCRYGISLKNIINSKMLNYSFKLYFNFLIINFDICYLNNKLINYYFFKNIYLNKIYLIFIKKNTNTILNYFLFDDKSNKIKDIIFFDNKNTNILGCIYYNLYIIFKNKKYLKIKFLENQKREIFFNILSFFYYKKIAIIQKLTHYSFIIPITTLNEHESLINYVKKCLIKNLKFKHTVCC